MRQSLEKKPLLELKNLKTYYPIRKGVFSRVVGNVRAVDGVGFTIYPNETLGLIGESGCGKSTIGRSIIRLENITDGSIFFNEEDITHYSEKQLRHIRPQIQMVFQDPYSSLNPRRMIGVTIEEVLRAHHIVERHEIQREIDRLLELVGLSKEIKYRYPNEFSGGQRQRISIVRVLALRPKLIILDEAVSALDVSIQAQILNLLRELQDALGLTYLFVSHGLASVKYISDRIAVMYLGKIVELATREQIFNNCLHPYTLALLDACPVPNPAERNSQRIILEGNIPNSIDPPEGCRFCTRCPFAKALCSEEEPRLENRNDHWVACHFPGELFDGRKTRV